MIEQSRKIVIITVALIVVLGLWMWDRYNLVRKIKEEHWRWREELTEKEVKLRMMEEKMRVEKKEQEKLHLEGALPEAQEPGQLRQEQEQAAGQAETQRIEEDGFNQEAASAQGEAAERELAEMERLYREQGRAREEAEIKAQQKEQAQAQP